MPGIGCAYHTRRALQRVRLQTLLRVRLLKFFSSHAQLNMPALLGMLVTGAALQNANAIQLPHDWSAKIRSGGLAVILLRAGLKIDDQAFKRAGFLVARRASPEGWGRGGYVKGL